MSLFLSYYRDLLYNCSDTILVEVEDLNRRSRVPQESSDYQGGRGPIPNQELALKMIEQPG